MDESTVDADLHKFFSPEQHLSKVASIGFLSGSKNVSQDGVSSILEDIKQEGLQPASLECPLSPTAIKVRESAAKLETDKKTSRAASAQYQAGVVLRGNKLFHSTVVNLSYGLVGGGGAAIFWDTSHGVRL